MLKTSLLTNNPWYCRKPTLSLPVSGYCESREAPSPIGERAVLASAVNSLTANNSKTAAIAEKEEIVKAEEAGNRSLSDYAHMKLLGQQES